LKGIAEKSKITKAGVLAGIAENRSSHTCKETVDGWNLISSSETQLSKLNET
jgi:hypothetical protein